MSVLFSRFVYPVWHWIRRDGVNAAIRELERNQWLSTREILALQERKLASLMIFAGTNVPYYRQLMREFNPSSGNGTNIEKLRQLPPLTKDIIRRQQESLISEDMTGNGLISNSTSGSTGESLRFYTDLRSTAFRKASMARGDSWTGWRRGDRIVRLWGAPMDRKRSASLRGTLHGWITGDRFLSSFDLSPKSMDEYIGVIRKFRPVLFVAYPGPLEQFAIHCRERGVKFPSLRSIISSAETLWPHQLETIEQAFGVKVYNRYGSREVAHIGGECEVRHGLHINADRLLVEIVDEKNQPCESGQGGRILVTDLDNYGMPLIRYEIGDRGTMAPDTPCSCGRGLPRLQKVEGRTMDIIFTPSGQRIGGTYWTLLLKSRPGLWQIQVVQENINGIVINYVPDEKFDGGVLDYFTKKIKEHCGNDFGVTFVRKENIDLTASGKRRLIVSLLGNEVDTTSPD